MSGARLRFVLRVLVASLFKRRSRLMLVGAALALAAMLVVALTAISEGVGARLGEGLKMFGANVTISPPVRATGAGGLDTGELVQTLDPVGVESVLDTLQGVESYSARVELPMLVGGIDTTLMGLEADELEAVTPRIEGAAPVAGEVLLGRDLATRLDIGQGGVVEVGGVARRVSGVIETGHAEDDAVVAPFEDVAQLTGGGVTRFLVRVTPEDPDAAVARIRRSLPDLEVRTFEQVADAEGRLLDRVRILLLSVTLGVALSATIAVGTTLNLVVLERGSEIGLVKALGGTTGLIVTYFALEQLGTALAAGVTGSVVGVAAAEAVSVTVFGAALPVSWLALVSGPLTAVAISFVTGVAPSVRVASVSSADALRGL